MVPLHQKLDESLEELVHGELAMHPMGDLWASVPVP